MQYLFGVVRAYEQRRRWRCARLLYHAEDLSLHNCAGDMWWCRPIKTTDGPKAVILANLSQAGRTSIEAMGVQFGVCSPTTVGPVILRAWRVCLKQSGPAPYRVLCPNASPQNGVPFREMAAMYVRCAKCKVQGAMCNVQEARE